MKRTIRILLTALILTLTLLYAVSCTQQEMLVGVWKGQSSMLGVVTETVYRFHEDMTGSHSTVLGMEMDFIYEFTEDQGGIRMTSLVLGQEYVELYLYKIEGDTLTLTAADGTVTTLTRQGE